MKLDAERDRLTLEQRQRAHLLDLYRDVAKASACWDAFVKDGKPTHDGKPRTERLGAER